MAEYVLILTAVAVVVFAVYQLLGTATSTAVTTVNAVLSGAWFVAIGTLPQLYDTSNGGERLTCG